MTDIDTIITVRFLLRMALRAGIGPRNAAAIARRYLESRNF